MNRKLISKALGGIDGSLIAQSMTPPASGANAPERTETMGNYQRREGASLRRIVGLALAACLVFALAATAYATNIFGLREMFKTENRELPEAAVPYIQEHTEAASREGLSARVTESLCNNGKLMATVEVSGGDKYILCEQSFNQEDPVSVIGIPGDQTLQEYADSQGKELLFVGVMLDGENFAGVQSAWYEYDGSGNLTVLADADLTGTVTEATCRISANKADATMEDIQHLEIPFTVSSTDCQERMFLPDNAAAIPGVTLGNATVTDSPMGMTIRWPETITDEDLFYQIMKVEIEGCTYDEGGSVMTEDGSYLFTANMVQGTIGDSFTVKFYDWDKVYMGEVLFRLK